MYNRFPYIRFSTPQYKSLPRKRKLALRGGGELNQIKPRTLTTLEEHFLKIQEALPQCRTRKTTTSVAKASTASSSEHKLISRTCCPRAPFLNHWVSQARGLSSLSRRQISQLPRDSLHRLLLLESAFGVSCCSQTSFPYRTICSGDNATLSSS